MRKKAHIAIREGKRIRNVYVMPEEKEEIRNIKKEQRLRSLGQAYEVWKQVKEIHEDEVVEESVEGPAVYSGILHELSKDDPDLEKLVIEQSEEINRLNKEIRSLEIAVATGEANIKALEKELGKHRARRGNKRKTPNQGSQRTVNEYRPELAEELDDTKIY